MTSQKVARSMWVGTPAVATHLLADVQAHLTPIGSFLRKRSLDELLQLSNWGQIPINLKLYAQSASSLDCGGLAATSVCGRGLT